VDRAVGRYLSELARELGKDAFLKAVLHDGVAKSNTLKPLGTPLPRRATQCFGPRADPGFHRSTVLPDCGSRFRPPSTNHVNPGGKQGRDKL